MSAMKVAENNNSHSTEKKMHQKMLSYLEYGAWEKEDWRKIRHWIKIAEETLEETSGHLKGF